MKHLTKLCVAIGMGFVAANTLAAMQPRLTVKTIALATGRSTPGIQVAYGLRAGQACLLNAKYKSKTYSWLQAVNGGGFILGGESHGGKREGGIMVSRNGVKDLNKVPPVKTSSMCRAGLYVNTDSLKGVTLMSISPDKHLVFIYARAR